MLTEIFRNEESILIGFDFMGDIQMFEDHFPHMKFIRYIENFTDAQEYYMKGNQLPI